MINNIFVGWDAREDIAFKVCEHSLKRQGFKGSITPLKLPDLVAKNLYTRKHVIEDGIKIDLIDGRPFATDFSFSRFLVPSIMNFQGWALFCDCDFLFLANPEELNALLDPKYAAICVHHDYAPKESVKMDGMKQEKYFRKNWSSFVLWNCEHEANKKLTPELVNSSTGLFLHRFAWLEDHQIGSVTEAWNWLEGHSSKSIKPKAIHFTRGGPWFENYQNVDYADLWLAEKSMLNRIQEPHP